MKYIAGKVVNNFPVVGRWLLLRASTVQRRVVIRIEDYGKKKMFRITGWQLSTLELPTDYAVVKRSGAGYDLLPLFQ
jgi:hypothetical protein